MMGDAVAVMSAASSVTAAAKVLQVDRVTLHRWIRAGKVPAPGGRRRRVSPRLDNPLATPVATPEEWAAAVRAAYALTATELEILALAERARAIALNDTVKLETQLAAMGRYQTLVKQLNLESPDNGEAETRETGRAWPRRVG